MIIRAIATLIICLSCLAGVPSAGIASGLRIAPIIVDIPRGAATTVTIENVGREQANIQARIFRWTQKDGREVLEPTRDVVASPPFARVDVGRRNIIRLVRISKQPIRGEESYRLLIDEIPRREKSQTFKVGFAVRYSIPVFFGGAKSARTGLAWSLSEVKGKTYLTATNPGPRRVRISELSIFSGSRQVGSFGNGLVGYVLGGATMTWQAKGRLPTSSAFTVTAMTENGRIKGEATRRAAR
ncbi:MAG: hypothetical protein RLZ98_3388 [Pseudomonadota bacterium]|jgi:fimbrial chaperone protein